MNENERLGLQKLEEAFRAVNAEEWENTERIPQNEIIYSAEYERKMEALVRAQKNPCLRLVNTVGKRAAMLAVVLLAVFGLSMSISAVRKPVVNFFIKAHDSFIELFFPKEDIEKAPASIEALYTFSRLPENSEWLTQFINEKDATTTWANESVNLTLVQTTLDTKFFLNEDLERLQTREIADIRAFVIERFGVTVYIWNTEEYAFHLVVKGYLSEEETADVMRSLSVGRPFAENDTQTH